MAIPVQWNCSVETVQAHWRCWISFFAAENCFHIFSAVTAYASWGWWVGMHACRHRTIALSFHSKERTTNSVLPPPTAVSKGVAQSSSGVNRFREMSGYLKVSLAAAHVPMVNGVSMVEVLPVPLSQGQKIDGICQLASNFFKGPAQTSSLPLASWRDRPGQSQTWFPALPHACVLARKETLDS